MRPTWAEISLPALRHNFRTLQQFVAPNATVCCVVKADAYGHGAAECARALEHAGAAWFGVTSTDEGLQLRQAGITARILLLAGFWRGEEEAVLQHNLTPAVWDASHIQALEHAAERMNQGQRTVPVHLKVDTGMARLGVSREGLAAFAGILKSTRHVVLEGVFSHLAASEVLDAPGADAQLARFDDALKTLAVSGLTPSCCHLANSAALAARPNTWKNMVRPGLALYGYFLPFVSAVTGVPDASHDLPVQPVLTWKTRVIALRQVAARTPIGYGGAYITQAPARIAVLPVGYADGLSRQLSSRGRVIVRGEFAPIVGNVAMDLTTIDITGVSGVEVGDEVLLIGGAGSRRVSAWDHASLAMTLPYEILCGISKRVPRKFVE